MIDFYYLIQVLFGSVGGSVGIIFGWNLVDIPMYLLMGYEKIIQIIRSLKIKFINLFDK